MRGWAYTKESDNNEQQQRGSGKSQDKRVFSARRANLASCQYSADLCKRPTLQAARRANPATCRRNNDRMKRRGPRTCDGDERQKECIDPCRAAYTASAFCCRVMPRPKAGTSDARTGRDALQKGAGVRVRATSSSSTQRSLIQRSLIQSSESKRKVYSRQRQARSGLAPPISINCLTAMSVS